MSDRVPFASSVCIGTTVRNTLSPERRSTETWLPFWRSSVKPARLRARTKRSPETLGNLGMSAGYFYGSPERFKLSRSILGRAPGFEIQLDCLTQILASTDDVFALGSHTQLRAAGHIPIFFFRDQRREAVSHRVMLTKTTVSGK